MTKTDGTNALEVATSDRKWDLVQEIVAAGADVNRPFQSQIGMYHPQLLIDKNMNTLRTALGMHGTALQAACAIAENSAFHVIKALMAKGANPNTKGKPEHTPPYITSQSDCLACQVARKEEQVSMQLVKGALKMLCVFCSITRPTPIAKVVVPRHSYYTNN